MRHPLLISASAIALIAGSSFAHAQGMERGAQSSQPPAAQRSAPPEKMAPGANGQPQRAPDSGTTGQGSPRMEQQRQQGERPQGERPQGAQPSDRQAPRANPERQKAPGATQNKTQDRPNAQAPSHKRGQGTTGQGAAGAAANLTSEQRTKISGTIRQTNVRPVTNVNFNVAIGTVVPRNIQVHSLPPTIIEVYPDWRGYSFILIGDEIVIVDPATHEIVAVIDA
jgi:hypothetical protein